MSAFACSQNSEVKMICTLIALSAKKYAISMVILSSLIQAESSTVPNVKPNQGCHGLGQITRGTARARCGITNLKDLYDPEKNIDCTARILSQHFKNYGSYKKALSAYQNGSYTTENISYVENVLSKKSQCN